MVTYLKHMGKYIHNQMKSKSFEEIRRLYEREQNWINDFVLMDSKVVKDNRKGKAEGSRKKIVARKRTSEKLDNENVKRQKIEDDAEKEDLKAYLDIIPGDDEAVNVKSLATKYPIIFSEMLDDFDRQDVLDLYRLVKERFETASPEGYDRLLWGDLITVFEPIHVLLMDTGIAIHMLIEKTYPLTQEMLSRMLSRRLEVDHECEMAYELLSFTRSQLQKIGPKNVNNASAKRYAMEQLCDEEIGPESDFKMCQELLSRFNESYYGSCAGAVEERQASSRMMDSLVCNLKNANSIEFVKQAGVAAVVHLYVFPAVPYKCRERCVHDISVMTDYAALGAPPDAEEVRDYEKTPTGRNGCLNDRPKHTKLHHNVSDVVFC
ncbi:retrovirus-related pol polyprotein from transposon TNT 1-94 [Tanacetum coccineum]